MHHGIIRLHMADGGLNVATEPTEIAPNESPDTENLEERPLGVARPRHGYEKHQWSSKGAALRGMVFYQAPGSLVNWNDRTYIAGYSSDIEAYT